MSTVVEDVNSFSIDYKAREIFLHRSHTNEEDSDVENRMSSMFIKNLRILDQKPGPILIHLNAGGGGNWEDGMAMYDAILFAESYITVLIYGSACSMSSIIPQSADFRVIMPNAYFMCHYGATSIEDSHKNILSYVSMTEKMRNSMVEIYAQKIKESPFMKKKGAKYGINYAREFITRKLNEGDWYITSEEAVFYGLVDDILGREKYLTVRSLKHE
jgi:ATP-dependent protease ClpP protease subunit